MGTFDKMDNFTADSLQSFLGQPPKQGILDRNPEPPFSSRLDFEASSKQNPDGQIPRARTQRAERISEVLRQAGTRPGRPDAQPDVHARAVPPTPPVPEEIPESAHPRAHDMIIRKHLSELVQLLISEGRFDDLAHILKDHRRFIDEMLALIERNRQ